MAGRRVRAFKAVTGTDTCAKRRCCNHGTFLAYTVGHVASGSWSQSPIRTLGRHPSFPNPNCTALHAAPRGRCTCQIEGRVYACSLTNNPLGLPLTHFATSPRPRRVQKLGGWDYLDYRWIEWAVALSVRPRPTPLRSVFSPILESELLRVEPYLTRAHYTVLRQGSMLHAAHIPGWLVSGS